MPSPFEDPNFSSKLDFDGRELSWKPPRRRSRRNSGAFPILLVGGVLLIVLVVLFFKASNSGAHNDSYLAKLEEAQVSTAAPSSAYVPVPRRELPDSIILPSAGGLPEDGSQDAPQTPPVEVTRIKEKPAEPPVYEPVKKPEPSVIEKPKRLPVPVPVPVPEPAQPEIPRIQPPATPREAPPSPRAGQAIDPLRKIGNTTFTLVIPNVSNPVFVSSRPVSRDFFTPFARQRNRAMTPTREATVSWAEAQDFAIWLTQVHRAKGWIGVREYYRLPTTVEDRDRDNWHLERRSSSNERREFRLTLTGDGPALRPASG